MNLASYIDDQLTKIRKTYKNYEDKAEEIKKKYSSEWIEMYGTPVHISPERVNENIQIGREVVGKLFEECDTEIGKIIKETEDTIAAEHKKAIQAYVASEPVPTDEQLKRVEQLRSEYHIGGVFATMKFMNDMDFHVKNETVYAYPYYLIAKGVLSDDIENKTRLNNIYMSLFPEIQKKADELKTVEELNNLFKTQVIIFKFNTKGEAMDLMERIKLKLELQDMGTISQLPQ